VFLTDIERMPDFGPVISALPRGSLVILRDYRHPQRQKLGERVAAVARSHGHFLLVAGDAELAGSLSADGMHVPEFKLKDLPRIRSRRPDWMFTVACHGAAQLHRAWQAGADAALLSPVFPTASHPGARTLGPVRLALLVRSARLPVYALGGVNSRTAPRLAHSGVVGIAAISGWLDGSSAE
jgi:thiamine-phosphate pyrophosphorylase